MADITELIHAGLPWNNPQKITVKADEYISQLVINRGLLNLLSNDYYLDLKTQRLNQYVTDIFGPHIKDKTIHWTEKELQDFIKRFLNGELGNTLDSFGLLKDTAFVIPIIPGEVFPKNINRIQNIINNCPKNLNGHTAIFALTPVVQGNYHEDDPATEDVDETISYNHTIGQYYRTNKNVINVETYESSTNISLINCYVEQTVLNAQQKCISLDNFYGGTVILMGNDFFVCEEKYKNGGKSLNTRQTRILLQQIQKNIDKDIVKHITITGTGDNNNCSVISFSNCLCDAYIWNLNVQLQVNVTTADSNAQSNQLTAKVSNDIALPFTRDLAWNFPCNLKDDVVSGSVRYIVADALNDQNFTDKYLTLRAKENSITSGVENSYYEETNSISSICLSGDYLSLEDSYKNFSQTFFGKYVDQEGQQIDNIYEGATLCFWMKEDFYNKNISEVPILYSTDPNDNGYYIGLEKVANVVADQFDNTQYLETSFASKKRTDISNSWIFWSIQIQPYNDYEGLKNNQYLISINYTIPSSLTTNSILPNRLITSNDIGNRIKLPYLNLSYPISFFGTPDIRSEANIRNILLFNKVLDVKEIRGLANENLTDFYNLTSVGPSQTFKNGMKGTLYVYNTTSMNVIGCNLSKREI